MTADGGANQVSASMLHRLTSYEPNRDWTEPIDDPWIVQTLQVNDLDRLPWPYKRYNEALARIALPRELPATTTAATAVLAGTVEVPAATLDLPGLARLLYLTAGVVRVSERNGRQTLFRAAGSAGARFPLEVYVAIPTDGPLSAGVHWYDPREHALVRIGPPRSVASGETAPTLVITGVPWRTGWRYRERGYRHLYWDAGTALAQLLVLADSAGIPARLFTEYPDQAVADLVGADGVHEFPLAIIALGAGTPAVQGSGPAAIGAIDAAPLQFPLVTAAQHAGDGVGLGSDWPRGAPIEVGLPGASVETVDTVVLRRGSQRRMDPTRGLSRQLLTSCLSVALRGIDVPHWVAVHDVDGVAPGLYRWPDLDAPLRQGNLRSELYCVCLDQGLAQDAAFVVVAADDVDSMSNRQYRRAQLAAGLVEGRLHLMAYAQGASACGMTFLDSEIAVLLEASVQGLLFTCVGVPEYPSRPGGAPGSPSVVRVVTPR